MFNPTSLVGFIYSIVIGPHTGMPRAISLLRVCSKCLCYFLFFLIFVVAHKVE